MHAALLPGLMHNLQLCMACLALSAQSVYAGLTTCLPVPIPPFVPEPCALLLLPYASGPKIVAFWNAARQHCCILSWSFIETPLVLTGGPLGWLYPSEIQPLETRSAGQGIATLVNLLFSFIIGQTYLSMLCAMKVTPFS